MLLLVDNLILILVSVRWLYCANAFSVCQRVELDLLCHSHCNFLGCIRYSRVVMSSLQRLFTHTNKQDNLDMKVTDLHRTLSLETSRRYLREAVFFRPRNGSGRVVDRPLTRDSLRGAVDSHNSPTGRSNPRPVFSTPYKATVSFEHCFLVVCCGMSLLLTHPTWIGFALAGYS